MNSHPHSSAPRLAINAPGPFFVTEDCIDCDYCRSEAPSVFQRNDATGHSFVHRQPERPEDVALAREVAGACPIEAIQEER